MKVATNKIKEKLVLHLGVKANMVAAFPDVEEKKVVSKKGVHCKSL